MARQGPRHRQSDVADDCEQILLLIRLAVEISPSLYLTLAVGNHQVVTEQNI
jgi:hypothetical protein